MAIVSAIPAPALASALVEDEQRLMQLLGECHRILMRMAQTAALVRQGAQQPASPSELPDLLPAPVLAQRLSISRREVYRLMDRGELPETRIPGVDRRFVRREAYMDFVEGIGK